MSHVMDVDCGWIGCIRLLHREEDSPRVAAERGMRKLPQRNVREKPRLRGGRATLRVGREAAESGQHIVMPIGGSLLSDNCCPPLPFANEGISRSLRNSHGVDCWTFIAR